MVIVALHLLLFLSSLPVSAAAPAAPSALTSAPPLPSLDEVVAALPRAAAAGQVLDAQNQPVPGAEVFLYYERGTQGYRDRLAGKTTTGASGRFRFEKSVVWEPIPAQQATPSLQSPPSPQKYDVLARHPALGFGFTVFCQIDPASDLKIKLAPSRTVTLSARDEAGKPLEGVLFSLQGGTRPPDSPSQAGEAYTTFHLRQDLGLCSALSGKEGKATLPAPRDSWFIGTKAGYVRGWSDEMTLCRAAELTGQVTDPTSHPLAAAPVWFKYRRGDVTYTDFALTDAQGRYTLKDIPGAGFHDPPKADQEPTTNTGAATLQAEDSRPGSRLLCRNRPLRFKAGEKLPQDIKMVEGVEFSGRVVSLTSGRPLAGLPFVLLVVGVSEPCITDAQGFFKKFVLPGSPVQMIFRPILGSSNMIIDETWLAQSNTRAFGDQIYKDRTGQLFKVKVWDTGPLIGKVLSSNGQPARATILMHSSVTPVTADAQGTFTLQAAPRDRDFDLLAIGHDQAQAGVAHLKAGATAARIQMEPTLARPGQALNGEGQPAARFAFTLQPFLNGVALGNLAVRIDADDQGRFLLEHLCPALAYKLSWIASNESNRDYDSGEMTLDLATLKPGEPVRISVNNFLNAVLGRVLNERGEPVAGARLRVDSPGMIPGNAQNQFTSDKKGNFAITRLATGRVAIDVTHPDYKGRTFLTVSDSVDCSVTLGARGSDAIVKVRVLDERDRPLAGAPLVLMRQGAYRFTGEMVGVTTQSLTADARGEVELRRTLVGPGDRLGGRREEIKCDLPGYDLALVSIPPGWSKDSEFELKLRPSAEHWSGRVVDEFGKPVTGAQVNIVRYQQDRHEAPLTPFALPETVTVTDSDGRYDFPRIGRQSIVVLIVRAEGFQMAQHLGEVAADGGSSTIALGRIKTLGGKVIDRATGKPVTMGSIRLIARTGGSYSPKLLQPDGSFKLDGIKPGEYLLQYRGNTLDSMKKVIYSNPIVTVEEGQGSSLTVELGEGIPVSGRIIDPATGKAPPGRSVLQIRTGSDDLGNSPQVAGDGSWEIYLPPGSYQFAVMIMEKGGYRDACVKTLDLKKGQVYDKVTLEAR